MTLCFKAFTFILKRKIFIFHESSFFNFTFKYLPKLYLIKKTIKNKIFYIIESF